LVMSHGAAIPLGNWVSVIIQGRLSVLPSHEGIFALDVMEVINYGNARRDVAASAEVPLEIADPEDEVGDGGGAWVDVDSEELVRIDS
jgi:hypothetical protein